MKAKTRFATLIVLLMVAMAAIFGMTACTDEPDPDPEPQPGEENAFVFTGSGSVNGRNYDFEITGDDSDETFEVTVKQLPVLRLDGHYVFVENKGYRMYFDDGSGSYEYSKYDEQTHTFSFTTTINMGNYGSPSVEFTYVDEDFDYDGVGLGNKPPVFNVTGWLGGILQSDVALICQEDGTFTGLAGGTWEFTDGQYVLTFAHSLFLTETGAELTEDQWKIVNHGDTELDDRNYANGGQGDTTRMTWEEYLEINRGKGPYTTTSSAEGDVTTYTIVCYGTFLEEIVRYEGSCAYEA